MDTWLINASSYVDWNLDTLDVLISS